MHVRVYDRSSTAAILNFEVTQGGMNNELPADGSRLFTLTLSGQNPTLPWDYTYMPNLPDGGTWYVSPTMMMLDIAAKVSGSTGVWVDFEAWAVVDIVDPHWLYVDGQLTMYWDKNHVGATGSTSNDQVLSAHSATVSDLNAVEGGHFGFAMRLNGPHSIFLQTETCEKMAFDMRGKFTPLRWDEDRWSTLDHGRLASDPDVVQLADGRLRINLSGGGERSKGSEGLIYAITSTAVQAIEEQGR